jgi:YbbR domain-containing protein
LYFDFSSSTVKKIPVVFKQKIQFKSQFGISDSVQLNPAFITITGPLKELSEVKYWETEPLYLNDLSQSLDMKISLKRPLKANITIYPNYVNVRLNIDEFTEKVLEIPVSIINNKEFRNVKLLPDKVKVTILSPLSNYPKTERKDFDLYVDLNNWKDDGYSQLPVRISRLPEFSKLVKIEPQTLDFIIQK